MKSLLWALLKLNLAAFILIGGFIVWLGTQRGEPGGVMYAVLLGSIAYTAYLNIATVFRARRAITASVKDGAIEAAARAIEFKDAANARVQERLNERRIQERDRR